MRSSDATQPVKSLKLRHHVVPTGEIEAHHFHSHAASKLRARNVRTV